MAEQQSKKKSLQESVINIMIGYLVAVISQVLIFPIFDIAVPLGTNLKIGLWFTVISLIRSYTIRRIFTKI